MVQLLQSEYPVMASALAAMKAHRRRSRNMPALAAGAALGAGAAWTRRAVQSHSGIQASPSRPVAAKAWRHPKRSHSHVAATGASAIPRLTPAWFTALPMARSAGLRY